MKRFAYENDRIDRMISEIKKRLSFDLFMKRRMIPLKEKIKEKTFKEVYEMIILNDGLDCSLMVIPIFGN